MFSKGLFFSSAYYYWDKNLSIKDNVIDVIQEYIPYKANVLTKKRHQSDAKDLIDLLKAKDKISDLEIYLLLQGIRQQLNDEKGEFKKRLDFCVQMMEEQNVLLKTMGTTGQAIKSFFGGS